MTPERFARLDALFNAALDLNLSYPDLPVRMLFKDSPQYRAFLRFLARYPILFQIDTRGIERYETLGEIFGAILAADAFSNTHENLVRGTWHSILASYMVRKQKYGPAEMGTALKIRFVGRERYVDELVGDLANIDKAQIV